MMNSQNPQDDLYKSINEESKIIVTDLTGDVGLFEPFKPQKELPEEHSKLDFISQLASKLSKPNNQPNCNNLDLPGKVGSKKPPLAAIA